MPDPIHRVAQIIAHKHASSDTTIAAHAIEQAKRIYLEMVSPLEAQARELIAANANLTKLNAELFAENQRLKATLMERGV